MWCPVTCPNQPKCFKSCSTCHECSYSDALLQGRSGCNICPLRSMSIWTVVLGGAMLLMSSSRVSAMVSTVSVRAKLFSVCGDPITGRVEGSCGPHLREAHCAEASKEAAEKTTSRTCKYVHDGRRRRGGGIYGIRQGRGEISVQTECETAIHLSGLVRPQCLTRKKPASVPSDRTVVGTGAHQTTDRPDVQSEASRCSHMLMKRTRACSMD